MLNDEVKKALGIESNVDIKDIHWKVQDSESSSLLFYRIAENDEGYRLFNERILGASFSWLITNSKNVSLPKNSSVIPEDQWPEAQKKILDSLYPLPKMKMIGITGTNGKTTTTDLVLQLAAKVGKKGISIGTLGVRESGKQILDFGLTSPSLIDLRKFLFQYGQDKDFCVMELSSHALSQKRAVGIKLDGAGFLSFSQDHLDYHENMEKYFEAKTLIFKMLRDEAYLFVPSSQKELKEKLSRVSDKTRTALAINKDLPVFFNTQFNRDNLEVAMAIVEDVFKVSLDVDLDEIHPPDGRFYIKQKGSSYLVVDFAHTPDALVNICEGIKKSFPRCRLKVLFGCGGDRDRAKRPLMAKAVDQYADDVYVTSDNPRSENPDQIIQDILKGFETVKPKIIVDRRDAVKLAFEELGDNEVLLLAGKGHENYILINGVKHPYSDIKEVDDFIARNKT